MLFVWLGRDAECSVVSKKFICFNLFSCNSLNKEGLERKVVVELVTVIFSIFCLLVHLSFARFTLVFFSSVPKICFTFFLRLRARLHMAKNLPTSTRRVLNEYSTNTRRIVDEEFFFFRWLFKKKYIYKICESSAQV